MCRCSLCQVGSGTFVLPWSCSVSVDHPLFFSLALSGFARYGPGVSCWCSLLLLLRSPLRVLVKYFFISFSRSSHLHSPLILIFTIFRGTTLPKAGCVCVTHLYRCKTSFTFCLHTYIYIYVYTYIYINAGGHRGPGGSVTNEDTSPGPV